MTETAAIARLAAFRAAEDSRFVRLALAPWASLSVEDRREFRRLERQEALRWSAAGRAW